MPLAYMNAYPPTISCSAASLTCRSRCSDGAATFTTQMSKPAMNIASSTTGSISQRRGSGSDTVSVTVRQEAGLELSKSTFSHHLRIMREAGLVTKRILGARGYARLRKDDVDRRFPGL